MSLTSIRAIGYSDNTTTYSGFRTRHTSGFFAPKIWKGLLILTAISGDICQFSRIGATWLTRRYKHGIKLVANKSGRLYAVVDTPLRPHAFVFTSNSIGAAFRGLFILHILGAQS